ncbi:MAG: alginate lyase family protein [Acidobacteria bacterium]|nr:alginate lyase family protein [Acidobacteriota bacterium]
MRIAGAQKLARAREMSAGEIAHRLRERMRSESDRIRRRLHLSHRWERDVADLARRGCLSQAESGRGGGPEGGSLKRYFEESAAQSFYLPGSPEGREALRGFVERRFPQWKEAAVQEAEQLRRHRLEILGFGTVTLGPRIDWHCDPVTGRRWPVRYWADYNLVDGCGAEDPKVVLELNRHQHLPRLGKAYFLTGEERYARAAVAQMESWIAQNPPEVGINWHSSLEIALRVLSWLWTLFFILPAEAFGEDTARRIAGSLFAQLDHIYRFPSTFTSPNTHLIGEATALFVAGSLFRAKGRAAHWRQFGAAALTAGIERQVTADGVHSELSSYYHCYTLDFYAQALALAARTGFCFPRSVWNGFHRLAEFLMHLTRPDGSLPLLGDDDGGRALALRQTSYRTFRDCLCAAAVSFRHPAFKHQAGEFCEETFWMLGEKAWDTYQSLHASPPAETSAFYPAAGYVVQRSDWGEQAQHLVFDCGGMGTPNGAHSHADALSFALFASGKELLVDPGTFVYNGAPEWRNFFRSASAHNTAVVDGRDPSEAAGTFKWRRKAAARVIKRFVLPGIEYLEAEHDGYAGRSEGVVHRRRLIYCRPAYWILLDEFHGAGDHAFDLYYHFAPDLELSLGKCGSGASALQVIAQRERAGVQLCLCSSASLGAEVVSGRASPPQGWVSNRYGERQAAPVLHLRCASPLPAAVLSVLRPWGTAGAQEARQEEEGIYEFHPLQAGVGAVACAVGRGACRDVWVYSAGEGEVGIRNCRMRGRLFLLRETWGVLSELLAVDACSFTYPGGVAFGGRKPEEYVWILFGENGDVADQAVAGKERRCVGYAES